MSHHVETFSIKGIDPKGHTIKVSRNRSPKELPVHVIVNDRDTTKETFMTVDDFFCSCATCDEQIRFRFKRKKNGRIVPEIRKSCKFPNGTTTVVEVSFPSGKAVVNDDLRTDCERSERIYDGDSDSFEPLDYNTVAGRAQCIKNTAELGALYAPCLNTMPKLYRRPDGVIVLAKLTYDMESEEEQSEPGGGEWELLASICTDLWATTIADYDDYISKGGEPVEKADPNHYEPNVFDLQPGRYRMTYHGDEGGFDAYDHGAIFAEIERIGD